MYITTQVLYKGVTDARGGEDVVRLGDNSRPIVMCVAALDCSECSLNSVITLCPGKVGLTGAD